MKTFDVNLSIQRSTCNPGPGKSEGDELNPKFRGGWANTNRIYVAKIN